MSKQIAQTILQQLGGNKFLAMTGAKNLIAHPDGLSFRLPSIPHFTKNRINHVKIILTPADVYTVRFGCLRGLHYKMISEHDDIYCDVLQDVFTRHTGLDTHL